MKTKLKFSQIFFPSLLYPHRIVITKQKKKKVAGVGGGRGEGACSKALVKSGLNVYTYIFVSIITILCFFTQLKTRVAGSYGNSMFIYLIFFKSPHCSP